VALRAWPKR